MRKIALFVFLALAVLACAPKEQALQFVDDFRKAVSEKNRPEIIRLYPSLDTVMLDSIVVDFPAASCRVRRSFGKIVVACPDRRRITLDKNRDGALFATESHGLFFYDAASLEPAKKLGQYNPSLNDVQNSRQMLDAGFKAYLHYDFMKNKISPLEVTTGPKRHDPRTTMGIDGDMVDITVTNRSPFHVAADDYYLSYSFSPLDRYMYPFSPKTRDAGVALAPGETHVFTLRFTFAEIFHSAKVVYKMSDEILMDRYYKPTGKEYKDFASKFGEVPVTAQTGGLDGVYTVSGNVGRKRVRGTFLINARRNFVMGNFGLGRSAHGSSLMGNFRSGGSFLAGETNTRKGTDSGYYTGHFNGNLIMGRYCNAKGSWTDFEFELTPLN